MIRPLPGAALILSLTFGCSDTVEIPTVELGGGGARFMTGKGKTPSEVYDNSFATFSRAHYTVRRNLDPRSQNLLGAREGMVQIARSIEAMRECVPDADRAKYSPYLAKYEGWVRELDRGTWGGSFFTELDRAESDFKAKLNPSSVQLLAEFPGPPAPKPEPKPPPPAASGDPAGLSREKVEVPSANAPAPAGAAPAVAALAPAAAAAPGSAARVYYKAWDRAHDDLIAAYKEKQDCALRYQDVAESLRLLKAQLAADKATTLQIYIDYYAGIHEKTKGFTVLPEKTTVKDIVDELGVAARFIRKQYNPDPGK